MNLQQSLTDFNGYLLPLSKAEIFLEFNRLYSKETTLTTPSIVCYVNIGQDVTNRPFVKTVVKCFISNNPSKDIKKDSDLFETFDEIFLHSSDINLTNQVLIDKEIMTFEKEVKRIKEFFQIQ